MSEAWPEMQRAVQLTGPDVAELNPRKPVAAPGPHQMLCRVEAVGLCFSDLKLLRQFSRHPRKSDITEGIAPELLRQVPSYVPGDLPTVPGHEATLRVCAVGSEVSGVAAGERYLIQADYRWLRTDSANAAFGYNFEGALQEYVLLDKRVITSPEGESMLLPASEHLSASAVALVEPWACVEDAYATRNRQTLKEGGEMLVTAETDVPPHTLSRLIARFGRPSRITWVAAGPLPELAGVSVAQASDVASLPDAIYDDVIYFGSNPERIEALFWKVAPRGLLAIALCGRRVGRPVAAAVGRAHYAGIRFVGTTGADLAEALAAIPASGEIGPRDTVDIIGAAGPMGAMHVIRDLCQGVEGITVLAGDLDEGRLQALIRIAEPLAAQHGVRFLAYDPRRGRPPQTADYVVLMVPAPALVAQAVAEAAPGAIINVFAGIPAEVTASIDLDAYVQKQLYMMATSGSLLEDMRTVLSKVDAGRLDTNLSVGAVSGLEGAVAGLRAVENREIAGKVIVYPICRGLGLTRLEEMPARIPQVAAHLRNGRWTLAAESALLSLYTAKER